MENYFPYEAILPLLVQSHEVLYKPMQLLTVGLKPQSYRPEEQKAKILKLTDRSLVLE